jgi:short-subunit dehydrogenase
MWYRLGDLSMKKVIITGASKGIGKALAFEYAKKGADLFLIARNQEELSSICNLLLFLQCKSSYYACDISNKEEFIKALNKGIDFLSGLDIVLLNAGINLPDSFNEYSSDTLKRILEVNVFSLSYAFEFLIPYMIKRKHGTIVGFSSLADVRGFPGNASYCASKIAITRILEGARVQLEKYGINVVTVKPGFVSTQMTERIKYYLPFLLSPEQAGKIIIKNIEKDKKRIYFPAPSFIGTYIIGLLPSRLYEFLMRKLNKELY